MPSFMFVLHEGHADTMSEKLDPGEVHRTMDGCFKLLMDEVHKCEGTIDKLAGDGVMALFGAPLAHDYMDTA